MNGSELLRPGCLPRVVKVSLENKFTLHFRGCLGKGQAAWDQINLMNDEPFDGNTTARLNIFQIKNLHCPMIVTHFIQKLSQLFSKVL